MWFYMRRVVKHIRVCVERTIVFFRIEYLSNINILYFLLSSKYLNFIYVFKNLKSKYILYK